MFSIELILLCIRNVRCIDKKLEEHGMEFEESFDCMKLVRMRQFSTAHRSSKMKAQGIVRFAL